MSRYLSIKSNQVDNIYNLIPNWLNNTFITDSEHKKRILYALLIYPLFFILPLPIIGDLFFVFYILPVALIFLIAYGVTWIKGAKMEEMTTNVDASSNSDKIFCRHCGRQVDSDSKYCIYCGKKL